MVFHWSLSDSKSPQVSRTHLSILAVLSNADIWIVSTHPPISKSSRPFNNPLVTVPNAQNTIGTIVTFIFHSFFISLARSRYLSFFSLLSYMKKIKRKHFWILSRVCFEICCHFFDLLFYIQSLSILNLMFMKYFISHSKKIISFSLTSLTNCLESVSDSLPVKKTQSKETLARCIDRYIQVVKNFCYLF